MSHFSHVKIIVLQRRNQNGLIPFHQEMSERDSGERHTPVQAENFLRFMPSCQHGADRRLQIQACGQGEFPGSRNQFVKRQGPKVLAQCRAYSWIHGRKIIRLLRPVYSQFVARILSRIFPSEFLRGCGLIGP